MKKTEPKPITKRIPVAKNIWLEIPVDLEQSETEKRICNFLQRISAPIYQFNPKLHS